MVSAPSVEKHSRGRVHTELLNSPLRGERHELITRRDGADPLKSIQQATRDRIVDTYTDRVS